MNSSTTTKSERQYDLPNWQHVGRLTRKGVAWSGVMTVGSQVLSTVVTIILARLLSPEDYGLVGMVATLTALFLAFSDMGLSWATVQRKDLNGQQVHNLFWINSVAGVLLWGVCAAAAPLLAGFYGEPRLIAITIATGATFALGGFAVQPLALLQRRMCFERFVVVRIGSVLCGGAVAVILAVNGWGYWTLVVQALATSLSRLVFAIVATGYRPGRPARDAETRTLLSFGGLLAASGVLIYLARTMDNVLIGRVWGATELGYYSRAYFLMSLPSLLITGMLASVMVPALAALQHDRERFGDAYRRALFVAAAIGCPLAAGLALVAPEAVRLVYGPRWQPVVPILVWLSIAAVFQPIFNTQGWLFTATGKGRSYLYVSVVYAILTVGSFAVGIRYGAEGVARAYAIAFLLFVALPILYLAHRAAAVNFGHSIRVVMPVGLATTAMIAAVVLVRLALPASTVGWGSILLVKVVVGASAYGVAAAVLVRFGEPKRLLETLLKY